MKISREDFLQALESAEPALAEREAIQQSKCFIFRHGSVSSFDDEMLCCAPTVLNGDLHGAVQAAPLIELLRRMPEDEISVSQKDKEMRVQGKGRRLRLRLQEEILLPLDSVEKPEDPSWLPLSEDFVDAANFVASCTSGKKDAAFALTCVHIHPKWVEASDNVQLARFRLETQFQTSVLVRGKAVKSLTTMGAFEFAETINWVHFRNRQGVVMACRRYVEQYGDLSKHFRIQGEEFHIPKGLTQAVESAGILAGEMGDDAKVRVTLSPGEVQVEGVGVNGTYQETKKTTYQGRSISFMISPEILGEIATKYPACFLGKNKLYVKGSRWRYVTRLAEPTPEKKEEGMDAEESLGV